MAPQLYSSFTRLESQPLLRDEGGASLHRRSGNACAITRNACSVGVHRCPAWAVWRPSSALAWAMRMARGRDADAADGGAHAHKDTRSC
jgi:hypothetical protein